jgi:hypothetical protein
LGINVSPEVQFCPLQDQSPIEGLTAIKEWKAETQAKYSVWRLSLAHGKNTQKSKVLT